MFVKQFTATLENLNHENKSAAYVDLDNYIKISIGFLSLRKTTMRYSMTQPLEQNEST